MNNRMNNRRNFIGKIDKKNAASAIAEITENNIGASTARDIARTIDPLFDVDYDNDGAIIGLRASYKPVMSNNAIRMETKKFTIFGNEILIPGYCYRTANGDNYWAPAPSEGKRGEEATLEILESYKDIVTLLSLGRRFILPTKIGNAKLNEALEMSDTVLPASMKQLTGIEYLTNLLTDDAFKTSTYSFEEYLRGEVAITEAYMNIISGRVSAKDDITFNTGNITTAFTANRTKKSIIGQNIEKPNNGFRKGNLWTNKKPDTKVNTFGFGANKPSARTVTGGNKLDLKKK